MSLSRIGSERENPPAEASSPHGPPRRRGLLVVGLFALLVVLGAGLLFYTGILGPPGKDAGRLPDEAGGVPASGAPSKARPPGDASSPPNPTPEPIAASSAAGGTSETSSEAATTPVISLPPDAGPSDLENLELPRLPYSIYAGAYRHLQEARTTQSELDSNYLPAYIVPFEIRGNVAQSLFGVTQDGKWYGVFTGHYRSKKEARQTLKLMMNELPSYQPEILYFPYALECGRFLETDEAARLSQRLAGRGLFPYFQVFTVSDGRALSRVLVGCYFSRGASRAEAADLQQKGFACRVVER